ncbi:MAG: 23S rRNA (uracil(1939)-C(5))-methyltransferase RlmD [Chitinophagales bacterium]
MGRSRRNRKELQGLEITAIAAEGRGLGRQEGKVVFVDYGIPGDVVDVRLTKNKKDYAEGNITNLVSPSELRQESFCELFGLCGGCRWQHISYEQQISYKHNIVEESFRRIGKLTDYELQPILGCSLTRGYRNKMEYTFSNQCWLTEEQIKSGAEIDRRAVGFHVSGQARRVINIEKCYLQDDFGNKIRNSIYEFSTANDISFYDHYNHEGFLRNLILRNTTLGEIMLLLCVGSNDQEWIDIIMNFVQERFPELTSINYVVNEKLNDTIYDLEVVNFAGKDHIIEQLGDIKYRIGPKSFFQTNSHQAKNLFDLIVEYAAIESTDLVYDLYCGIGSIGLYVAHLAKEVVGVETVPEAIEDAKLNMNLNGIVNTKFHAGSSERLLSNEFLNENGRPDIVITDPPRAGMHKDVVEFLLRAEPKKIVYVSCNPVTQARDIQLLQEKYTLVKARPVDMFPHTYHVENVALLVRK